VVSVLTIDTAAVIVIIGSMPRKLRVQYPGAIYHLMNRGDRRKGDPEKVEIASQLRAGTTLTLKWIAQRLNMGAWTHLLNCLVPRRKRNLKSH